ncbi:MAG TPA: tetratricopeptide repeat protein [Gemmataceae bacterium]|nr:tetratricopeptide repeat protein [Gemmataceae bacterium]
MRRMVLSLAMLLGLARPAPLQAGVYNLDPPRKYPSDYVETHVPQSLKLRISYVSELQAIRDSPRNVNQPPSRDSLRESYLNQLAELEDKQKNGVLTVADRVNLGACLIRLGRETKAQQVLEESLRQVPDNHALRTLLLFNLAAACQEDDSLLPRALQLQREALKSRPALVPGWKRDELSWLRHVEQYVLALMELRNREAIRRGGRPAREQLPPYPLFPIEEPNPAKKVQFLGESGEYEAGGIAWKQFERLPANADSVVLQLLLWRPSDTRLLWLYGELQNVHGKIDGAYYILNDRVRDIDQWRNRELNRHIRVLSDALPCYRELFTDSSGFGENVRKQALLLGMLAPRGALLAPPIGAAANEIGGVAASVDPANLSAGSQSQAAVATDAADASQSGWALPDWRQLTVSFIAGMVVAVLWMLQWQQWRRHRRFREAARSDTNEHFTSKGDIAGTSHYSRPADG